MISARTHYEEVFPNEQKQWKIHAFLETMDQLEISAITNLVCIGDSNVEIDAGKHLATQFPTAMIKTVKFRENPSPDELIK